MAQVLVTGGSGFIASWCIAAALEAGHDVRTTVRSLSREAALRANLHGATDFDDSRLTVVAADLNDDGWEEAVAGCDFVMHVASPTLRQAVESEDAMIAAARDGVLRVLRAARDAGVQRVVLTSALGAIGYGHAPRATPFTEEDWTNVEADIPPYQRSKTLAERAAWDFVETEGKGLELAAVHPVAVLGPVMGPDDPPSLRIVRGMLSGQMPACPPFGMSWVDVRDVADLQLRAMTDPAANGQRLLASADPALRVVEVARMLKQRLGDAAAKVPRREMPVFVAWLLGFVNPAMRQLRPQLGKSFTASGAKAQRLLGWKPRPIADTIADTGTSLIEHDLV